MNTDLPIPTLITEEGDIIINNTKYIFVEYDEFLLEEGWLATTYQNDAGEYITVTLSANIVAIGGQPVTVRQEAA